MRACIITVLVPVLVIMQGCFYSLKGSSVPAHLKTIAIPLFDDQSGAGEPGLRERFTNKLIERFRQDNSLQVADRTHADSILEGVIVTVSAAPIVVTGGETLQKQRLTVTTKIIYEDTKQRRKVFDKQFSNYGDYDVSSGASGRQTALGVAIDKVTEDILNETVSGW
ncbi:MAG: LptE family protein [Ignavibacteriae bacterium]|nr:LptE family protein [Ignavibacteria bacterium]MBI3364014.1 LptE family protein [Ignavibacteriota bacterium]